MIENAKYNTIWINSSTKFKETAILLDLNAPNSKIKFPINPMTFPDINSLYSSELESRYVRVAKYTQLTMMPIIAILMQPLRRSTQQQHDLNIMANLINLFCTFWKLRISTNNYGFKLECQLNSSFKKHEKQWMNYNNITWYIH